MKHTTFETELSDIKRRAIQELHKAVQAHGKDSYDYTKFDHLPELVNGEEVYNVFFMGGYAGVETSDSHRFLTEADLTIEDILKLTDYVVETDEVEDVSGVYPVPVTWVDCDDIESEGFDTSDVTQEKLNRIAEIMQEYSCLPTQYDIRTSDLYAACKKVCLNQKED